MINYLTDMFYFQDMTDLRRLEVPPSPTDMYSLACKHFQTAKTLFENIINPNEEVKYLTFSLEKYWWISCESEFFVQRQFCISIAIKEDILVAF